MRFELGLAECARERSTLVDATIGMDDHGSETRGFEPHLAQDIDGHCGLLDRAGYDPL